MTKNTAKKRKRRLGDRRDGRRLRTLDPIMAMMPFIMDNRAGSTDYFHEKIEVTEAEKYIRRKREEGLKGFGMLYLVLAAFVRISAKHPGINRFVSGQRVFAREQFVVNLTVKKKLALDGQESVVKMHFDRDLTAAQVYQIAKKAVDEGIQKGDTDDTDKLARLFAVIPRPFLRFVIKTLTFLDYYGAMPKSIEDSSPFHGSMFISDLASIRLPNLDHHLYEFGNIPLFVVLGGKKTENVLQDDGGIVKKKYIDFGLGLDERICDGFYFSVAFGAFKHYMAHPDELDSPPERVVEDID
ncbi:MAG: hypothetical protein LBC56_07865 [Oscillospiraceae bacterium]|nr:hypothetical protein [Oscillospiraceae bacterium]